MTLIHHQQSPKKGVIPYRSGTPKRRRKKFTRKRMSILLVIIIVATLWSILNVFHMIFNITEPVNIDDGSSLHDQFERREPPPSNEDALPQSQIMPKDQSNSESSSHTPTLQQELARNKDCEYRSQTFNICRRKRNNAGNQRSVHPTRNKYKQ